MTLKQLELLGMLHDYISGHKKCPTFQELSRHTKISRSAIHHRLQYLRDTGFIMWESDPRVIKLVAEPGELTELVRLCRITQTLNESISHHVPVKLFLQDKKITGKVDNMEWSIRMFTINGQWEYIREVERVEVL